MRHPLELECKLNHASRLLTLGVTKSNANKLYLEGNYRKNDCTVSNAVEFGKYFFKALRIENSLERHDEISARTVN